MPVVCLQACCQRFHLVTDCTRTDGHVLGVEFHVAGLDAFGGQRSQGSEVLRQAGAEDDAGQLLGRFNAQNGEVGLGGRMHLGGAADDANGHGKFHASDQVSFGVLGPR